MEDKKYSEEEIIDNVRKIRNSNICINSYILILPQKILKTVK
jgi:hypothetical protein